MKLMIIIMNILDYLEEQKIQDPYIYIHINAVYIMCTAFLYSNQRQKYVCLI